MRPIGTTKIFSRAALRDFSFPLMPAAIGGLIGTAVVFDFTISVFMASLVDLSIFEKNIFLLYPYELLTGILLLMAIVLAASTWFTVREPFFQTYSLEKVCIVIFLISSQTLALTRLGIVDGYDIAIAVIFLLFLFTILPGTRTVVFTRLDVLNLLMLTAFILGIAANGIHPFFAGRILLMAKLVMISIILVNFLHNVALLRFFIHTMIAVTTISAIIAIIQEILYAVTGTAYVGLVGETGLRFMFDQSPFGRLLRVPAFLMSYKALVFLLIVNIALTLNLLLHVSWGKRHRWLLSGALILMLFAFLLTSSKDGLLGLLLIVTLSMATRWRSSAIYLSLAIVALGAVIYVTGYWDEIISFVTKEFAWGEYRIRLILDREGVVGFLREPTLFGRGPGDFYTSNYLGWPAHNNWILAANEMGLFGLGVYILIIGHTLYNLAQSPKHESGSWMNGSRMGITIAFIGLLVVFQTHAGYLDPTLWIVVSLAQAVALIESSTGEPSVRPST
jgi:hypothetical protein